jgi:hypothetical protein
LKQIKKYKKFKFFLNTFEMKKKKYVSQFENDH